MSRPVSTMVIVLRKPPTSFNATFNVSGGGLPFITADRDAVLILLSQPDGVEVGDDVGAR